MALLEAAPLLEKDPSETCGPWTLWEEERPTPVRASRPQILPGRDV